MSMSGALEGGGLANESSANPAGGGMGVTYVLLLLACGVLVAAGVFLSLDPGGTGNSGRVAVGAALIVVGGLGAVATALVMAIAAQVRKAHEAALLAAGELQSTVTERLGAISVMLNVVTEQQLISDRAKAVAYREKDRETLRRAIREEMGRGDWEAARALVLDMEAAFGYRGEAERFRGEIASRREDGLRKMMLDAQDRVDRLMRNEDWTGAQQEAARFIATHPDYEPGRNLPASIEGRRQSHKAALLERYNEAVARHDGDAGMELLRLLDSYLTPAEGERMAESARSIFNDRKTKLREQFTSAVQSQSWEEALRLGQVITLEFPNAKFAQEIADMMPTLRDRAAGKVRDDSPVGAGGS